METFLIPDVSGFTFEVFVHDCVGNHICKEKEWEPHITQFTRLYNKFYNIQNIIDIGANLGYHTIMFSREVTGNVYAFEPQIQNLQLLYRNVRHNNLSNIKVSGYACGDEEYEVQMHLMEPKHRQVNMGDFTPNIIAGKIYNDDDIKLTTANVIRLDKINFPQIDLIKIDVQGWEIKVLVGARNLLQFHKPIIIIEFEELSMKKTDSSCQELFDYIKDNDYYIFLLDYIYPSDHVCVHNDRLDDFRLQFKDYIHEHTQDNDINHNVQIGVTEKITLSPSKIVLAKHYQPKDETPTC